MNEDKQAASATPGGAAAGPVTTLQPIVFEPRPESIYSRWRRWGLRVLLAASIGVNLFVLAAHQEYFSPSHGPVEKYHSGEVNGANKIALIHVTGTIMPPFTKRILRNLEHARDDDKVKGIVLVIDSPGGLVADSHEIYHRLTELRKKKPVAVSMKSIAASGGYYVAMGAGEEGRIYAEPTTWTGSIGVIIPRYEFAELAKKLGIDSKPIKTGQFKDALSPFHELSTDEEKIWKDIIHQAFDQFVRVIDDNRKPLNYEQVATLATGRIYTATDAKKNGLIDEIGYEEDAIADLQTRAELKDVRVVTYESRPGVIDRVIDLLLGSAETQDPAVQWRALLEASVPRAMYFCSWGPVVIPPHSR